VFKPKDLKKAQKQDEHCNEMVAKIKTLKNFILQKKDLYSSKQDHKENQYYHQPFWASSLTLYTIAYLDYMPP
jgi:hypothetical protein